MGQREGRSDGKFIPLFAPREIPHACDSRLWPGPGAGVGIIPWLFRSRGRPPQCRRIDPDSETLIRPAGRFVPPATMARSGAPGRKMARNRLKSDETGSAPAGAVQNRRAPAKGTLTSFSLSPFSPPWGQVYIESDPSVPAFGMGRPPKSRSCLADPEARF